MAVLVETGMPVPAIRQAVARSRRVVEKYVSLYQQFSHPDHAWRMGQIRRLALAHPHPHPKTKPGRGNHFPDQRRGHVTLRDPSRP